ncbi:hypothetical protein QJS10_CPB19g01845 [Acorus calamus]|uniref:LsmAD domain-containing protein n=1 Tax=Acorus calamus TaxID=4465 RepID=A0AAV9CKV4_ACOCL|nr:hypothetical protein QJS10_CPB19g01845 [Acorus calamus]
MSIQQGVQHKPSANGSGRRRTEREMGNRRENKLNIGRSSSRNFGTAGLANRNKVGGFESPSHDRLTYLSTCIIGHHVEVQVQNGCIFSGILHAISAENDFGVILKMARLTKDGSTKGQKSLADSIGRAPTKTLIIPAKELVQVIAKDVSFAGSRLTNDHGNQKQRDLMTDSVISHNHYVETERELERWTPDEDDPRCPELENIFDSSWNRNWDQFETNEILFGVKSTFDEELYTTKLEKGPQKRELEREATRIAREIEREETNDVHLAEERGSHFFDALDLDEESRFSSVLRVADDGSYEENGNSILDNRFNKTSGRSNDSAISWASPDVSRWKSSEATSSCSSLDEEASSQVLAGRETFISRPLNHARKPSDCSSTSSAIDKGDRMSEIHVRDQDGGENFSKEHAEQIVFEDSRASRCDGSIKMSTTKPVNTHVRPGSSASSTSECPGSNSVSSGPALSSRSSVGSLSSEKSTLNPHAKEFRLNPNAKSFTPSASLRPPVPMSDGSFHLSAKGPTIPQMHSLPVGVGIGSFSGHQSLVYNPQVAVQNPQPYIHPNGVMYGQQMIIGQPQPFVYMPSYPPEMQYKGREF